MSRWFRTYDDIINDPKILMLPEAMRWIWIAMLCIASKNAGEMPSIDIIALSLRVKKTKAAEYLTKLVTAGLIDKTETGFAPHNWNARQYKSDVTDPTAASRQKAYRERNKTRDVDRNATVTVTDTREQIQTTETEQKDISSLRSEPVPAKPKATRAKPKLPLPDLWQMDEQDYNYATDQGFKPDKIRQMSRAFMDHHRAKATLSADWHASWRTWCGNEIKFNGHSTSGAKDGRRTVHDAAKDLTRTLERIAEFDEPAPSGVCIEAGGTPFRLLPPR